MRRDFPHIFFFFRWYRSIWFQHEHKIYRLKQTSKNHSHTVKDRTSTMAKRIRLQVHHQTIISAGMLLLNRSKLINKHAHTWSARSAASGMAAAVTGRKNYLWLLSSLTELLRSLQINYLLASLWELSCSDSGALFFRLGLWTQKRQLLRWSLQILRMLPNMLVGWTWKRLRKLIPKLRRKICLIYAWTSCISTHCSLMGLVGLIPPPLLAFLNACV